MSKGGSLFCSAAYLEQEARRIFHELEQEQYLKQAADWPAETFAARLAHYQSDQDAEAKVTMLDTFAARCASEPGASSSATSRVLTSSGVFGARISSKKPSTTQPALRPEQPLQPALRR